MTLPFPRGNNYEIVKILWWNLKILSRTTGSISTKLCTVQPWIKGIPDCSYEGPCPFPRKDIYEITKIYWRNLKNILKTTGSILIKLSKSILGWRGSNLFNEGSHSFSREHNYEIAKIHWQNLKFNMAHFNQTWYNASLGKGDSCLFSCMFCAAISRKTQKKSLICNNKDSCRGCV